MLELNDKVFTEAIALAVQKAGSDKQKLSAIDRATKLLDENFALAEFTNEGLLIASNTSEFVYRANGECVRFEGQKEVYCPGYFFNNHICKHRTAYEIVKTYFELTAPKTVKLLVRRQPAGFTDPSGKLFDMTGRGHFRFDDEGNVIEFRTQDSTYMWFGSLGFRRI